MAPPVRNVTVADIERRLDELREHETTSQRTSVLTHTAWVPFEWARAAGSVVRNFRRDLADAIEPAEGLLFVRQWLSSIDV